jgi:hypothetical protein
MGKVALAHFQIDHHEVPCPDFPLAAIFFATFFLSAPQDYNLSLGMFLAG